MSTTAPKAEMMHEETWKTGWWIQPKDLPATARPSRCSVRIVNEAEIASARWMFAGRSDYDVFVNGTKLEDASREIGFAYAYDVKGLLKCGKGETNELAAELRGPGMTRLFRGAMEVVFTDGRIRIYGTCAKNWRLGADGAEGLVDRTELRKDFPPSR